MPRWAAQRFLTAVLIGLLFLAACGKPPGVTATPESPDHGSASSPQSTDQGGSGTTDQGGSGTTDQGGSDTTDQGGSGNSDQGGSGNSDQGDSGPAVIAWVPFGPASPGTPRAPERWYGYLATMQCDKALDDAHGEYNGPEAKKKAAGALYQGTSHACIAVQTGDQEAWRQAVADLAIARKGGLTSCLDRAVLSVLRSLVEVHLADPARQIVLAKPGPKSTACPFSIEEINPNKGPVQGGNSVTIHGIGLHDWWVKSVLFGEQAWDEDLYAEQKNTISAVVPRAQQAGRVRVRVVMYTGERYEVPGGYRYEELKLEKIEPSSGPVEGGTKAVISGTGLAASAVESVRFGDEPTEQVSAGANSGNSLDVTVPKAATSGPVPVVVVLKTGDSVEVPGGYTYSDESGATDSQGNSDQTQTDQNNNEGGSDQTQTDQNNNESGSDQTQTDQYNEQVDREGPGTGGGS